jgi:PilZ domain
MRRRRISDIIPKVTAEEEPGRRVPLDAEVTFLQPAEMSGVAVDANEQGMSVETDGPLEPGTRCIAVVQLPDGEETHERLRVVWSRRSARGWITGLAFAS